MKKSARLETDWKIHPHGAYVCVISIFAGRGIAVALIVASLIPVLYIHAWYLSRKKGINGWTGEPKRKYYEFRGWGTDIFHDKKWSGYRSSTG